MVPLEAVDPQWAWSPWKGDNWSLRLAAHLHRRAGFGGSRGQLHQTVQRGPAATIAQWLAEQEDTPEFQRESDALADLLLARGDLENLGAWWLYRMNRAPNPLVEKMTLFWHGHFATSAEKVSDERLMYQQNELFRRHALSNFAALVHQVSRDPAMLLYLDSATNRKAHPNENFARELMELFCLGEGNYGERDITELARCFTGWEVRRQRYRFNPYQHDAGEKQLLGRKGAFSGEQGIDLVLEQPATARFLATKLFRFFICDEPAPPRELIEPLAEHFRTHDLNVGKLVQKILGSQLFFSAHAVGRKIRSPAELFVGLLQGLDCSTNLFELNQRLREAGQGLFYPPNVKGWDGGRAWLNSASVLARVNGVTQLLTHEKSRFAGGSLEHWFASANASNPQAAVTWMVETLCAVAPPAALQDQLRDQLRDTATHESLVQALSLLAAQPEFQLG